MKALISYVFYRQYGDTPTFVSKVVLAPNITCDEAKNIYEDRIRKDMNSGRDSKSPVGSFVTQVTLLAISPLGS